MNLELFVNNKQIEIDVSPKKRLLDILREDLDLTGTKEGCGKGECGACTVFLNGVRVNSCLVPAFQLTNARILTIEGLRNWKVYSNIERSYIEHGAVQCGFCMTGFIMSTIAYLNEESNYVSENQAKQKLAGNICRCTGHTKIIEAVNHLANEKEIVSNIKTEWQDVFPG